MGLFGGGDKDKFKHRKQPDHSEPVGRMSEPEPKRVIKPEPKREIKPEPEREPKREPDNSYVVKLANSKMELEAELENKNKELLKYKFDNQEWSEQYKKLAIKFKSIDDKNIELKATVDSVEANDKKITELEAELDNKNDMNKELEIENGRLKQEVTGKNGIINGLETELGSKDNSIRELNNDIQELKNKLMSADRIKEENARLKADLQELKSHKIQDNDTTCRLCNEDYTTRAKLIRHCRGKAKTDDAHRILLDELEGQQSRTGEAEIPVSL